MHTGAHTSEKTAAPRPNAPAEGAGHDWGELPLSYARALSLITLVLVLLTSMGLSAVIANSAREKLLAKQTDFALLLAQNLNHQIYMRFTVPTALVFGQIALRQPAQYERLDHVVLSVIHGWNLQKLRVYDFKSVVAYSTDKEELGDATLAGPGVASAWERTAPEFEIVSAVPVWKAFFMVGMEPGTFVLRTTYPMRPTSPSEATRENEKEGEGLPPAMGVLEFSQDITGDFESVIAFQRIIVGVIALFSAALFILLMLFMRRADRILARRMAQNRALEENLHMNERLAGMGRVVASIAHEIRNPLGIIRSSAELLLNRADSADPRTGGILRAIYDEAMRLSRTVNDFLDYARPRKPRQDPVDLRQVAEQVLAFQKGELERLEVEALLDMEEDLAVRGDKDLLYRALYNLVANALQAMDGAGVLRLAGRRDRDGAVTLALTDSGPGFDPENLPRLLDPFFTTKEGGTGLGLPIVNSIIAGHEGSLVLKNAAEGGASAIITLPGAGPAQRDAA